MKNIYLTAGKIEDVLNDIKDQLKITSSLDDNQSDLKVDSSFGIGSINTIKVYVGMTLVKFDMLFYDDMRLSVEPIINSPILIMYCLEGNLYHSFGDVSEKTVIKKKQTAILKSASSANSVLNFEKNTQVKFYLIALYPIQVDGKEQNSELVMLMKNKYFSTKKNFLEIKSQNLEVVKKIRELNLVTQEGIVQNSILKCIINKIIEIEIKLGTNSFSMFQHMLNFFILKKLENLRKFSETFNYIYLRKLSNSLIMNKTRS